MKIGVVGLGLIGGSIFKALQDKYEVIGISSSIKNTNISDNYNIYTRIGETLSINFRDNDIYITYPQKASLPIFLTEVGIVISLKLQELAKQPTPILVT